MINFLDKHFGRMGNRLFQMAYIYAKYREGKIPDIYLQDLKYFDEYREDLRQLFKQEGDPIDYISIHVRRGKNPSNPDELAYSENPFYVDLMKTDYYQKAMAQFPNEKFLVFTDLDLNGLQELNQQEPFKKCEFSYGYGIELQDFNKMSRCRGHIIANSSFSWWASYLGGGKTVAPSQWFSNGTRINYPKDWMVV